MKHIYFLFVGILALYEIMKALNCKRVYSRTYEYIHSSKEDKNTYLKKHPMLFFNEYFGSFWMDNINSRTNDKSMGFIFGGDGFVFIKVSTPR